MKIILNDNEVKHIISDAFCNSTGVYGAFQLQCKKDDYKEAKEQLSKETDDIICREDVWMRILFMGKSLFCIDMESLEEKEFNYESIKEKLSSGDEHLAKMIMESLAEEGDADTADNLMQYMVYGDIIYC